MVDYNLTNLSPEGILDREKSGIAAWSKLLPVVGLEPEYAGDVGQTHCPRHDRLSEELDLDVFIKLENTNPGGSFKDRGLALAVALGVALGARRFCLPTQGNAGVSAALFSARIGAAPALVYMPEGYQESPYHKAARYFGAEVHFAGANIAATGKALRNEVAPQLAKGRLIDVSTFFEPGRLEGKKTLGLEIWKSFEEEPLPDTIVYPTGGGTGLVGIWKAFEELRKLGLLPFDRKLPRLFAVQSSGCAPVVKAFESDSTQVEAVMSRGTIADGLDVPSAIMGHEILRALRDSKGGAVAVSDENIIADHTHLGKLGVSASYEAAATLSALRSLKSRGQIDSGCRALLLFTAGHPVALARS